MCKCLRQITSKFFTTDVAYKDRFPCLVVIVITDFPDRSNLKLDTGPLKVTSNDSPVQRVEVETSHCLA